MVTGRGGGGSRAPDHHGLCIGYSIWVAHRLFHAAAAAADSAMVSLSGHRELSE